MGFYDYGGWHLAKPLRVRRILLQKEDYVSRMIEGRIQASRRAQTLATGFYLSHLPKANNQLIKIGVAVAKYHKATNGIKSKLDLRVGK